MNQLTPEQIARIEASRQRALERKRQFLESQVRMEHEPKTVFPAEAPATTEGISRNNGLLLSLTKELLHKIWPPESILIGKVSCKHMRDTFVDVQEFCLRMDLQAMSLPRIHEDPVQALAGLLSRSRMVSIKQHVDKWEPVVLEFSLKTFLLSAVCIAASDGWTGLKVLDLQASKFAAERSYMDEEESSEEESSGSPFAAGLPAPWTCPNLEVLNLNGCEFRGTGQHSTNLIDFLASCSALRSLSLAGTNAVDCSIFGALLACSSHLTHLDLSGNTLADAPQAQSLPRALASCRRLSTLRLAGCSLSYTQAEGLAGAMPQLSGLTELDISHNRFSRDEFHPRSHRHDPSPHVSRAVEALLRSLHECPLLATLKAADCQADFSSARVLASTLEQLPALSDLDISGLRGGDGDIAAVYAALSKLPLLATLSASGSLLVNHSAIIAAGLQRLPHLTSVRQHCSFGPRADVAGILRGCRGLRSLELMECSNRGLFGVSVCERLGDCRGLERLRVGQFILSDGECALLTAALVRLPRLRHLALHGCEISEAGMTLLAPPLRTLSALTTLDLSDNYMRSRGLAALTEHLPCTGLTTLDLARNGIGFRPGALATLLRRCSALEELRLAGNPAVRVLAALQELLPAASALPCLRRLDIEEPCRVDGWAVDVRDLDRAAFVPEQHAQAQQCEPQEVGRDASTVADRAQSITALAAQAAQARLRGGQSARGQRRVRRPLVIRAGEPEPVEWRRSFPEQEYPGQPLPDR